MYQLRFLLSLLAFTCWSAAPVIVPPEYPYLNPRVASGGTPTSTTRVPGTFNRNDYRDGATVWGLFVGGAPQYCADTNELFLINPKARVELMTAHVKDIGHGTNVTGIYMLRGGLSNTNWLLTGCISNSVLVPTRSFNIYNTDGSLESNRRMIGNNYDLTLGHAPSFPLKNFTVNYFGAATFNGLGTNDVFRVENPVASVLLDGDRFTVTTGGPVEFNDGVTGTGSFDVTVGGPVDLDGEYIYLSGYDSATLIEGSSGSYVEISSGNIVLESGAGVLQFATTLAATNDVTGYVMTSVNAFGDAEWATIPAVVSTNIGNSDLTVTDALRTLDGGGNAITLTNFSSVTLASDGDLLLRGPGNVILQTPQVYASGTNVSVGMFLRMLGTNGAADWATIPTGNNFANADLAFTGDRFHNGDNKVLSITNLYNFTVRTSNGDIDLETESDMLLTSSDGSVDITGFDSVDIQVRPGTPGPRVNVQWNELTLDSKDKNFFVKTPTVNAGTAAVGQVLTVLSTNGVVDFATPAAGVNIYNANGTLTGNRTLTGAGYNLTASGLGTLTMGGSIVSLTASTDWSASSSATMALSAASSLTVNTPLVGFSTGGVKPYLFVATPDSGLLTDYIVGVNPANGALRWRPGSLVGGSRLAGSGTVPTVVAGVGAGTSPTVTLVRQFDLAFTLSVVTGTTPTAAAVVATVTFGGGAYATAPHFSVSPSNAAAAELSGTGAVYGTSTTTTFVLNAGSAALAASTTYLFEVIVIQ